MGMPSDKQIAIIVPRLKWKAPVLVVRSIINKLHSENDINIDLFYMYDTYDADIGINSKIEKLSWLKPLSDSYDIVHTHGFIPDFYARFHRKNIRKHYVTIHNYVFADLRFKYGLVISWIIGCLWIFSWRKADKLVCVSQSLRKYYSQWFDKSKLIVIHNGIDKEFLYDNGKSEIIKNIKDLRSLGFRVIGTVGVLERRKRIDFLIRFISERTDSALVIIGEGHLRKDLEDLARKYKVSDRCLFCGFIRYPQSCYEYFDLFVSSSSSEGFGLALVEAVSCRIPVICPDIDVFRELFEEDEVTFYISGSQNSLSQILLRNADKLREKVEKAYSKFLNHYTSGRMSRNYYELYKNV